MQNEKLKVQNMAVNKRKFPRNGRKVSRSSDEAEWDWSNGCLSVLANQKTTKIFVSNKNGWTI